MHAFRRDRRTWLLVVLLIVVGIALALLLLIERLTPAPTPLSSSDLSPYEQLWAQVQPDGTVSQETALEAFAVAIAPLPGVTPPAGATTPLSERMDGTFAIDWLLPYYDQLTPDQQRAVDAALAPDPNAPVHSPESSDTTPGIVLADATPEQFYDGFVESAIPVIESRLGRKLTISHAISINPTQEGKKSDFAITYAVSKIGTDCYIHVNPLLETIGEEAVVRATMAHEVFHCFQFDWEHSHGGLKDLPAWIKEGQAEWVGETVGGPSSQGGAWWGTYLYTTDVALWARGYDAIGFYQHLQEEGIDPWSIFDPMLAAATTASAGQVNSDAYKAADATDDTFQDTWASGIFREPSMGAAWNATSPWYTTANTAPKHQLVSNGSVDTLTADVVVNQDWSLFSTADIVEIDGTGHVRLYTTPDGNETDTAQRWLCTRSGGCDCPDGTSYAGPDLETVTSTFELALTGGLAGASAKVTGHALDEFCKPRPSVPTLPPSPPCKTDCPYSNGDPHIRTVNRYRYDFMAEGEFTLLRSPDASLEVQARQAPVPDSRFGAVSKNTAVAARVNGHRLGLYAAPDTGALTVKVDGQAADPSTPIDLGSGGAVRAVSKGVEIDFPDGTVLWALSVGTWGINAVVQPSDALRSDGMGLLGSIVPGGIGLPALPDGTRLPAAPDEATRDKTMYGQFADAWRVTDATTLFDYDPGTSTATFTDRNFPADVPSPVPPSFSPDLVAAAEAACAGVSDQELHDECTFDVEATGDDGYATSYAAVEQDLYDVGIVTPSPTPAPSGGATGAVVVTQATDIQGSALSPDGSVVDLSIDTASGKAQLVAVDAKSGRVLKQVEEPRATDLHIAAGSLWAAGLAADASGGICTVTRFDPDTLDTQATFPIPCTFGYPGPRIVSMGTSVWFVDTSAYDLNAQTGAKLTRIDPTTNQPGSSVPLGFIGGCCQDSQGAVFCYCSQGTLSGLADGGSGFVSLGQPSGSIFPVGDGVWTTDQNGDAVLERVDGSTSPPIPLQGAQIVGGDANGLYVQQSRAQIELLYQRSDGSAPTQVGAAPVIGTGLDQTNLDYETGGPVKLAAPGGLATLWLYQGTVYGQWAPLP